MGKERKIIHVHFLANHKNYYFGSVSAIYNYLSDKEIGVSEIYLRHQLREDGNVYLNKKVMIVRSRLLV